MIEINNIPGEGLEVTYTCEQSFIIPEDELNDIINTAKQGEYLSAALSDWMYGLDDAIYYTVSGKVFDSTYQAIRKMVK